ncbi:hypothetical protein AB833_12725 [Chromatiales bacterium (ex Bugula neritina AB1)]|nr:hypothetical protein AB833_12725 [Chromatiales bacterium (ex Bugula neritina AB1)]
MGIIVARRLKIITGLILFTFVTVHLMNLAIGFFSLPLADQLRPVMMFPFSNRPVGAILFASVTLHMFLGLQALYKRNTLQMTRHDTVQLVTALLIIPLLVPHAWSMIANKQMLGITPGYFELFQFFWIKEPIAGIRQVLLLIVIWVHGCLGLFTWLRIKLWWPRLANYANLIAVIIPVLALLAFVDGGMRALGASGFDPAGYAREPFHSQPGSNPPTQPHGVSKPGKPDSNTAGITFNNGAQIQKPNDKNNRPVETDPVKIKQTQTFIGQVKWRITYGYLALLLAVLLARAFRLRGQCPELEVRYASGDVVKRPAGMNLLEMATVSDIPHANLCRGRGRCGTCRIRIHDSDGKLDPPSQIERDTLTRTGSAENVRLACQLTPGPGVITIERLIPPDVQPHQLHNAKSSANSVSPEPMAEQS